MKYFTSYGTIAFICNFYLAAQKWFKSNKLYIETICYETICLVKSHSQDAAANMRASSIYLMHLPYHYQLVVHWHWSCALDCVSFLLAIIKLAKKSGIWEIFVLHQMNFLPVEHRSWNRDGYTPPPLPLKIIWKFFVNLVLLRKQSFNFPGFFSTTAHSFWTFASKCEIFPAKNLTLICAFAKCTFFSRQKSFAQSWLCIHSPPLKIMNQFHRSWNRL